MSDFLYEGQRQAVENLRTGCILCGGVGSGKSRTALSYYFQQMKGKIGKEGILHEMEDPLDLYIITPAMKRDKLEWDKELAIFSLSTNQELNYYKNKVVVDSWNNIQKYTDVTNAFFIFDEDRVVGWGAWSKAFIKIARLNQNQWILLSATPGDSWEQYCAVFVANGFYKNKTDFYNKHVEWCTYTKFPKIRRFWGTKVLEHYRNKILVDIPIERDTIRHEKRIVCDYDKEMYKDANKRRWDPFKDEPMESASTLCYVLRRICNSDKSRGETVVYILEEHKRAIIFYNFDYELEILKLLDYPPNTEIAEWNGHKHQDLPKGERWVYLVNYGSGAEGWNCITTDTMIFYSLNYSYRTTEQAKGRIDRANTTYKDLYFYRLESMSGIDLAIRKALSEKRDFNERRFAVTKQHA